MTRLADWVVDEDHHINWLGQKLEVGSLVYRGARDGNTSSFKVGIITKINPNETARVKWIAYQGGSWLSKFGGDRVWVTKLVEMNSAGSPSLESLVLLPDSLLDELNLTHRKQAIV